MKIRIACCLTLLLVAATNFVHASDWVTIYDTDDQLMELDRSSIKPFQNYKFARQRVTFKKPADYGTESGVKIKYMTYGALFSCKERTETTSIVQKYSVDRKLISKQELKGMVLRASPGSISERMLKQVCTDSELRN